MATVDSGIYTLKLGNEYNYVFKIGILSNAISIAESIFEGDRNLFLQNKYFQLYINNNLITPGLVKDDQNIWVFKTDWREISTVQTNLNYYIIVYDTDSNGAIIQSTKNTAMYGTITLY